MSSLGLLVAALLSSLHVTTSSGTDALEVDTPVDADRFWRKSRIQKIQVTVLTSCTLFLACFSVGWDLVVNQERQALLLTLDVATVLYWAYVVWLSLLLIRAKERHLLLVYHMTVLTLLGCLTSAIALTPRQVFYSPLLQYTSNRPIALSLLLTIFAFMAFIRSGLLRTGPPLHYSPPLHAVGPGLESNRGTADKESNEKMSNVSSLAEASPFSYLFFVWTSRIVRKGNVKKQFEKSDLPYLTHDYRAGNLYAEFSTEKTNRGLLYRLLYCNRRAFTVQTTLALVNAILYYGPAFFLQKLVAFLETSNTEKQAILGYAYCLGLFAALFGDALVSGQLWFISNASLASRVRVQLNTIIYSKALRRKDIQTSGQVDSEAAPNVSLGITPKQLSNDPVTTQSERLKAPLEAEKEDGDKEAFSSKTQVLNLFSVDVDRVADFTTWSFTLVDAPAELAIGTYFLYKLLGSAGIIGILVNVLFLPLNHFTSTAFAKTQDRLMSARDRRVALMNEVLSSIRMVKYMAHEAPFEKRINKARDNELKQQRRNFYLEAAFSFIWDLSPVICVVVAFTYFTKVQGHALKPNIAFASLAVFNELRFALNALPDTFVSALQSLISLRRIEAFLNLPEVNLDFASEAAPQHSIHLVNATTTWPLPNKYQSAGITPAHTPKGRFMLKDLNIAFVEGQINLVTGSLGSGKTLLLLSLLGEADLLAGQIVCPRSKPDAIRSDGAPISEEAWICHDQVAYVPQSAWLQNATVRDNILFGTPFNQERYDQVLFACSLRPDLALLEDGDMTEIGERGVGLSGGQKQRVSLARAVYSRAGVLLLDDVLSAVDASTAKHIYTHCLSGPLLQNRTVILVSHHTHLVAPSAAKIIVLERGSVRFDGTGEELKHSELATTYLEGEEDTKTPVKIRNKRLDGAKEADGGLSSGSSDVSESELESESEDEDDKGPRKLMTEETRAVGAVSASVWRTYLTSNGGIIFWACFVAVFVGTQIGTVGETLVLSLWSRTYDGSESDSTHTLNFWLFLYAAVTAATVVLGTLRYVCLYSGAINASKILHQRMLAAVLRAPMRFYDTTAVGRLINRFSKDMEQVDSQLPDNLARTFEYSLGLATVLVSVTYTAPMFLVGSSVLAVAYRYYARQYSRTARELRRLDSVSKTPIFTCFGETVAGIAVIRAFGTSSRFLDLMLETIDGNLTFFFYLWASNRWLAMRFSLLSAAAVLLTGLILVQSTSIDASLAGFALTFSLNISNDVLFLVRRYTALELSMVAVERVKEIGDIPSEAPAIVEPRPPAAWPHAGAIEVENICVRYAEELPDVLNEVSFSVKGGQKIGIVGSTGSGKSTLASCLFRFLELHSGRILIDGIDISKIGLYDLRSRLSLIAQDPTIFSGTLRSALDVFGEYEDAEIYDALRRVYLLPEEGPEVSADSVTNKFANLDTEISEQGSNLSSGERQLLCMARALLARHKVLILDEATSSVDYKMDEQITSTIQKGFHDVTLITIAHRLRTVISFDKILVLEAGRVVEFDAPAKLIEDEDSRFYALCAATGKRELKLLKKMATATGEHVGVLPRPRKVKRKSTLR